MTWKRTTNSTGNLGGGVLILGKNGLTYTSLSTQSLSSLDPSSDYLAITVKIKGASPIHLFNVYVSPIRSSSSDSRPKSFSLFLLPSSPTTHIFGDFKSHHSSWDSHSLEDQSGKELFDWLLSSDLLPLNNPEHHTLLHRATGNQSSPDLSLVPAQIASKCTWQTLPDLGSDHLPISITIPTSPLINSIHRPPSSLSSSSSSSFEGYPLQARHKQDWGRGFILLLPQTAALPGSDAGSDVIKPASSFVIQNRQTACSMWCPMYRARC